MSKTVKKLIKNGTIKFLFDKGYISSTLLDHSNYFDTFTKHRKTTTYRQACILTAEQYGVSVETVKRAIMGLKD